MLRQTEAEKRQAEIDRLIEVIASMKRMAANPIFFPPPEEHQPETLRGALQAVAAIDAAGIARNEKRLAQLQAEAEFENRDAGNTAPGHLK